MAMKVGTYGTPYNGTFDGAGYTISNLSAELEAGVYSNEGLFKTIGENGTVKNLGMINASIKPSSGGAGAICGTNHGLIENCYNLGGEISIASIYGGGIAGENDGIIRRCYNTGSVESTFTYGSSIGGIAGYSHDGGEIIDCYNTGDITGAWYVGGICGELNGGTVKNCYGTGTATATYPGYGSTANPIVGGRLGSCAVENTYYINAAENNAGGKTSAQFASGEVAYLLNANRNEVVWGQTIGTESAPVLGGKAVYAGYEYCYSDSLTYSNDSSKVYQTKPEHNFAKLEYDATSHWYSCTNDGCTAINGKENHKGGQATYFKKAVCEVCNQVYGELSADTIAPTGEISIGTNNWNEFSDSITFDLFFKDAQTVEITAQDDSYDHDGYTQEKRVQIEYYLHTGDTALTKEELDNKTFTAYTGSFNINPGNQYIIYAKITDHAGNVTYLSSDGVVLDAAAPVIAGVTNGATYYTTQSVTVTDENLASVTVNNQVQSASAFTLPGNVEETYTVVATDKAGNVTNYTVTMKPIGSLADSIEGITTDNVTSEDNAAIEAVKAAVEAVNTDEATDEEAEALKSILDSCESLITKLKESVQAGSTGNTEKVEDITADNVKPEDKEDLTAAKEDLENALKNFGGNYTEGEKAALEEKLEQINNALNSIEKAVTVQDAITVLPDTVEPDDTDAEKLINEAKEQYDLLTNHEKSLISEELKEKLENLMGDLLDYRIIEGDGSRWTVGEDGSVTMTANGSVEKFVGIKVDGKEVDAANYTVKPGSTIISLKPEYLNTLSVGKHTLTVIYTDGETSGEFEILKKAESTASGTGDNNNIALWIAILSVSGIVLSVMTYRKKKQSI